MPAPSATSLRPAQPPFQALWRPSHARFPAALLRPPLLPPIPPRPVPPPHATIRLPRRQSRLPGDSLHLTPFMPGTAAGVYEEETAEKPWSSERRASLDDDMLASGRQSATGIIGVGEFSGLRQYSMYICIQLCGNRLDGRKYPGKIDSHRQIHALAPTGSPSPPTF